MSCNLINGLNAQLCRDNQGGLIEVYIANFDTVTGLTESNSYVTAIDTNGGYFYTFKPNKNTGTWSQPIMGSPEAGTVGYEHTCTFSISKNESDDINTIKLLARANTIMIVRERSGRYYLLGPDEGLSLTEGSFEGGSNLEDLNGWTLTFKGNENDPSSEIDPTIIAALLA